MNDLKFIADMRTMKSFSPESESLNPQSRRARKPLLLDIDSLRGICGYCNWIPIIRGLHLEYFEQNFPCWEWNDIVPKLFKKGILRPKKFDEVGFIHLSQSLYIASDIENIEFIPKKNEILIKVNRTHTTNNLKLIGKGKK